MNQSEAPAPLPFAGLDYLSSPTGVIGEAQSLAAATFSADRTWFLVNGCSAGVHAAVAAVAGPGDTLLVARNCHQSACAAMTIAGGGTFDGGSACYMSSCNMTTFSIACLGLVRCVTVFFLQKHHYGHQSLLAWPFLLAGCQPWWVQPEVDAQLGIAHGITPTALRDALTAATEAGCRIVGVLVVSPTYYGAALPISGQEVMPTLQEAALCL